MVEPNFINMSKNDRMSHGNFASQSIQKDEVKEQAQNYSKIAARAAQGKEAQEVQERFLAQAAQMFDNRQREEEKKQAQRQQEREELKEENKSGELSILFESDNEQDSWMDKSHQANANFSKSNDDGSSLNKIGSQSVDRS